jgi:two-component system, chemotaxis family, chemotaxis protein CheY
MGDTDRIEDLINRAKRNTAISVLVVDDSPTMRRIIIGVLKRIGDFNIIEAGNGLEALEKLSVNTVQLIISDWNMPQMSGIDFVRAMKAIDSYKSTPILMVTTVRSTEKVLEAARLGVNGYIIKPFKDEDLAAKIKTIFKYV